MEREVKKKQVSLPKKVELLDEKNPKDAKVIKERKQRIKDFKLVSRDLPNTSSLTYFGRPAF